MYPVCTLINAVLCPYSFLQIVHMAKTSREHPICAAIGDGANDVSMIQEAHVGLGESLRELRFASHSQILSLR